MPGVSAAKLFLLLFLQSLPFLTALHMLSDNVITCDPASQFRPGAAYEINRNAVLASLAADASVRKFSALRVGVDSNSVYGLMRCRSYGNTDDCQTCVDASVKDIVRQCPKGRRASALYDACSIQYSDSSFFLEADFSSILSWININSASNVSEFYSVLGDLMRNLSQNASTSPLRIAAMDSAYMDFATIHAMVQCSASLDNTNCSTCLEDIINQIPSYCPKKDGCRLVTLSCDLRYEDRPFPVIYEQWFPGSNLTTGGLIINGGRGHKSIVIVVAVAAIAVLAVVCALLCFFVRRRKKTIELLGKGDEFNSSRSDHTMKPLPISIRTLKTATSNFSHKNKLGEGGFGPVYKGILPDGRQIAVKRLSNRSSQGIRELKTEVLLVGKLLHRNLVRLTGFCLEEDEQLLVYEFLQNGSLDQILFDGKGKSSLNWELRYRIIVGIVRGLQYLHEDSHMRIIHRDLKAGNILLDQDMNPKISDFGLAKLFLGSQTQGLASQIAGTCGYMAPEYVGNGHISTKCDVYSYGVLVLEIVTGQKNSSFTECINLPNHAWRHWTNGTALEILDPSLGESWSKNQVLKCIQVGLLCTQDSAPDRPTMSQVVLMLSSETIMNPAPKRPAFYLQAMEHWVGSQDRGLNPSAEQVSANDVTISEFEPR